MNNEKWTYIFIIIALMLLFLTQKQIIPNYTYIVGSILLSIYFFPIKMIYEIKTKQGSRAIVLSIISSWLCGTMVVLATVFLYIHESQNLYNIFTGLALINALFGFSCYLFSLNNEKALLHMAMNLFYIPAL